MEDCKDGDILVVTTTVGSRADAGKLARAILGAKLAACVQLDEGVTSFYRWEGRLHEDAEVRLTIKTLPRCAQALQVLFREQHPYEVPQFVAWSGQGSPAYATWVRGETP
jgi:periplasmic divalent cation tolerance protein